MRNLTWSHLLAWVLAAFFFVGGLGNIFASEAILADYARWSYPDWFHYVTGALEIFTAALILLARRAGLALAAMIMASAVATVLWHGEFIHAVPGAVVLALILLTTIGARRA